MKSSQTDKVLEYLRSHRYITETQANIIGIKQLKQCVNRLRKAGYIITEEDTFGLKSYELKGRLG